MKAKQDGDGQWRLVTENGVIRLEPVDPSNIPTRGYKGQFFKSAIFTRQGGSSTAGIYGDFSQALFGYMRGLKIQVLRELYMGSLQLGLLGHIRAGGGIITTHKAFARYEIQPPTGYAE